MTRNQSIFSSASRRAASCLLAALSVLCALPSLTGCAIFPEWDETPLLIFNTGFTGTTIQSLGSQTDTLAGTDPGFSSLSDWSLLSGHPPFGSFIVNYESGTGSQRFARMTTRPEDPANPALEFVIAEPHITEGDHMKGRVSAIMEELDDVHAFSQRISFRLDPSMVALESWSDQVDWLTLFEFFSGDFDRLTVSVHKDEGAGQLYWQVKHDTRWLLSGWTNDWKRDATDARIVPGEWYTVELYVRSGGKGEARTRLSLREGTSSRVIVDSDLAVGRPEGFSKICPMKLYTSDTLINWLSASGATTRVMWDDWTFWLNDGLQ